MVKENTLPLIINMIGRAQNTKTIVELYTGPRMHNTKGKGWRLAKEHDAGHTEAVFEAPLEIEISETQAHRSHRIVRQEQHEDCIMHPI